MTTELFQALPVYVIGDSHALPYRNLIFRDKWTGQMVAVRSTYISGLTTHDFFNAETGEFHPQVIQTMEYEGLVRDGGATHVSTSEIDFAIAGATAQPVTSPLIMFTMGDIDIRAVIMPMLGDQYDFVPPFDLPYPVLQRPLIPWDVLNHVIAQRIRPFIDGLKELQEAGFTRIYVQSVVPPSLDETRLRALKQAVCPASVRTKLAAAFNHILRTEVEAVGLTMIDIWPDVTVEGYLKPQYELDGVHLPPAAAQMHLEQLLEHAINRPWQSINHIRYDAFYRMACGLPRFASAGDQS